MVLRGVGRQALHLDGLATDPIRDIEVRDTYLDEVASADNVVRHVRGLTLVDVTVNGDSVHAGA
jgi:hypothetical protein